MATKEMFLVTRVNDHAQWAFANEDDILPSLELSYTNVDHVVNKLDRTTYIVRVSIEDVVNSDVFTVQRVAVLEAPEHL